MSTRSVKIARQAAKESAMTIGDIIGFVLKIIGTVFLVLITAAVVFAFLFVVYIKTNLTTQLDVAIEEYTVMESSKVFYKSPDTGNYTELLTLENEEFRIYLGYDEIPKNFINAAIAIEDKRFYEHNGVDWFRTVYAVGNMFLGDSNAGGSTLTQQLIKNLTQEDQLTVQRKLLEIFRAIAFEKKYSKEQILEWYLNKVYFGNGCYGIEAASNYYFGKGAKEMTLAEIACVVGITNNPSLYDPFIRPEMNKERQELILEQMYDQEMITREEMDEAIAQPLHFTGTVNSKEKGEDTGAYSWFVDALYYDIIDDLVKTRNCTEEEAEHLLLNSGWRIYTTYNPDVQACIDAVYEDVDNLPYVSGDDEQQIQSAMVVMDPYTGDVLGLAGGVGDKDEQGSLLLNRATQSTRSPGSSIKPIASYGPALEYGIITPETRYLDGPNVRLKGTDWMPNNYDYSYMGVVTIRRALLNSLNTIAAQLVDQLTPEVSYEFVTKNAGLSTLTPEYDCTYASMALGEMGDGVTVRDMASAYTMFPNSGLRSKARLYTHITDAEGNLVMENPVTQNVAISEKTAYWMTDMLVDACHYGTGSEAYLGDYLTGGKTGTSSSNNDRWFVGFTPYYVGAVWVGYDIPTTLYVSGNPASQIFYRVMSAVHEGLPDKEFPVPEDTYLVPIPGIQETSYTVKGVDETGKVLYTDTAKGYIGDAVEVKAKTVENYEIVGDKTKKITIGESGSEVTFTYKALPVVEPPKTETGGNTNAGTGTSTGTNTGTNTGTDTGTTPDTGADTGTPDTGTTP
ncbi:MAG: transglycosylase domain-containing protein [Oscillospiraceae bacterium]|nr:transglycosylase domain-containing protein [Oscillospiraceae bacterium]